MLERAFEIVPREEIFAQTGLQFMQINTLYQMLAMRLNSSPLLDVAESMLMVPDLFHWLLSGVKVNEMTEASTSQFFDPRRGNWATELFERLQLPTRILGNDRRARHEARAAAAGRASGERAVGRRGRRARIARHGQRRDGRAGGKSTGRRARLVLYQLRHLVADGRRNAVAGRHAAMPGAQFHERRGRRRHDAAAEKHLRPVDGAGMPAVLESSRRGATVGTI